MPIVDSHCHLFYDGLIENIDDKIRCAVESDVKYMLSVSTGIDNIEKNIEIAQKYKDVFCSVGIHPSSYYEGVSHKDILPFINEKKVVAIGEVGLDYFYDTPSKSYQQILFHEMLELSKYEDLPYIFHARDCFPDIFSIIDEHNVNSGVFHCYTGNIETARVILDMGFYISFSGIITFNKSEDLRDVAKYVPLERILVETDSPYLAPIPYRGKTNEPAYVYYVLERLAQEKKVFMEDLANITTKNFFDLFKRANNFVGEII